MSNIEQAQSLDQQLTNNYADLIQWVKDGANQAGSFLNEQTPLFIQEYLNWIFWSGFITGTLMLVIFITLLVSTICYMKKYERSSNDADGWCALIAGSVAVFVLIGFLTVGMTGYSNALKAKIAPRVLVVEKIGSLIK